MNYLDKAGLDALWAKIKNEYVSAKGGVISGDITLDGINTGSLIVRGDARFIGAVYAPTFTGNLVGNASTATKATQDADGNVFTSTYATKTQLTNGSVTKVGTSTVGGTTTPIYLKDGVPTALSYTIAKSVPSNAVFTDTWRPVVNNLTSDSTDSSLSAAQGKALKALIDALPTPMQFKGSLGTGGTITSLPTASASNEGYTYKVITDGTYASQAAKIGDVFISNGTAWVLVPSGDEPSGTVTSVGVSVPTGLSVSNTPITTSGTIAISLASGYSIPTTTKQAAWDAKQDAITTSNKLAYSLISGTPTSLPASDVSAWAKKSSLAASDVPTLAISKIDGLQTALDGKLNRSGGTMTGDITMGTNHCLLNGTGQTGGSMLHWDGTNTIIGSTNGPTKIRSNNTNLVHVKNGTEYTIYTTGNKPTKSDVGLGNVDNTADANKSVNYANSAGSATTATNATQLGGNSAEAMMIKGKLFYHDIAAFCNVATPLFENTADGTTWIEATLNKEIFASKESAYINVTSTTRKGSRWTWKAGITWARISYVVIGWTYQSPIATVTLTIESSSDNGETWRNLRTQTGITTNSEPSVYSISDPNGDSWLRITITQTSETGSKSISSLKLMSSRWGDQGMGSEYEKPYCADASRNIYPWSNNGANLGLSTNKWANVYATTFVGALSGNATTVTNGVYTTGNQTIGGTKTFSNTISGNISGSAGSLATSRTLWGQSFNGTANVSGDMTGVGSITASGNIQSTKGVSALGIASLDVSSATGSIYVTGIRLGSSTNTLIPSDGIVTLTTATSSADGIMSKTDKAKLDGIASGATANVGTVTSIAIKMNGSTKGTITSSGTIDLGTVITAHQDISGKANKATTLAGYGITDAKIVNGVITLGSNTITPLTSHQSLANYVTLNGAQIISGKKTFTGDIVVGSCTLHYDSTNACLQFNF